MHRKYKLLIGLAVLVSLAGCAAQPAGTQNDPIPSDSEPDTPPVDSVNTFYVDTERGTYFCISMKSASGTTGYAGLSCHPVDGEGGS